MKKFLPYMPMLVLVFGLFVVQLQSHSKVTQLLSNTLSTSSVEVSTTICTKPEQFSERDEIAWCNTGLVANIAQHLHTWQWSCIVGEEVYSCHFAQNVDYATRPGFLFKK